MSVPSVAVPPIYAFPVVVAPPLMVSPVAPVPPPMVDDAEERKPARSGFVEKTRLPAVPVSSVRIVASSEDVSISVLWIILIPP